MFRLGYQRLHLGTGDLTCYVCTVWASLIYFHHRHVGDLWETTILVKLLRPNESLLLK